MPVSYNTNTFPCPYCGNLVNVYYPVCGGCGKLYSISGYEICDLKTLYYESEAFREKVLEMQNCLHDHL